MLTKLIICIGLAAAPPAPAPSSESRELVLGEGASALHGSLLTPGAGPSGPAVLILPGSGPTDRDGNTPLAGGPNNCLRLLAEGLAARGIAAELMTQADALLAALATGHTVAVVPPSLMALFRPSVQPYLISWFGYDPAVEVARLAVPVLIAQGTTDTQVAVAEAERLAQAHPPARLLVVPGMNHVLKMAPAEPAAQLRSYSDPTLPVAPELLDGVATFVSERAPGD